MKVHSYLILLRHGRLDRSIHLHQVHTQGSVTWFQSRRKRSNDIGRIFVRVIEQISAVEETRLQMSSVPGRGCGPRTKPGLADPRGRRWSWDAELSSPPPADPGQPGAILARHGDDNGAVANMASEIDHGCIAMGGPVKSSSMCLNNERGC